MQILQPELQETRNQQQEKSGKKHKQMDAKQHATKQQMDHWRNQEIPGNKWKQKHKYPKSVEYNKSNSKREVYSDTSLTQEIRKISNKQLNFTPKGTKKEPKTPKVNRRKETIKIRAEINEIETKK